MVMPQPKPTMRDLCLRFWQRVNENGPVHPAYGRCWLWMGCRMKNGYGKLTSFEWVVGCGLAHRFSWHIHNGAIPSGRSVLHRCDNPPCVNPAHLFLGTQQDNLADMRSKGHQVRGEAQGSSIATDDVVRQIRSRHRPYSRGRDGAAAMAKEFGLGVSQVGRIIRGEVWRHVT